MKDLPIAARLFVGAVLAAGAVALVVFAPHTIANPVLFALLLGCSSLASALKVSLPLASQRLDDVGVVRGRLRGAAAARRRRRR